jgi:hypothetical protein
MVGPEEGVVPELLGRASHRELLVVRRPLLGLGEDPEVHARNVPSFPLELAQPPGWQLLE